MPVHYSHTCTRAGWYRDSELTSCYGKPQFKSRLIMGCNPRGGISRKVPELYIQMGRNCSIQLFESNNRCLLFTSPAPHKLKKLIKIPKNNRRRPNKLKSEMKFHIKVFNKKVGWGGSITTSMSFSSQNVPVVLSVGGAPRTVATCGCNEQNKARTKRITQFVLVVTNYKRTQRATATNSRC